MGQSNAEAGCGRPATKINSVHTRHTLVEMLSVEFKARRATGLTNEVCRQPHLQQAHVSLNDSTQRLQLLRAAAAVQVHSIGRVITSLEL